MIRENGNATAEPSSGRLLLRQFRRKKEMNEIMVIGIAGGTGSGKTTITDRLVEKFGGNVSVVHHDNYYKAHHNMT